MDTIEALKVLAEIAERLCDTPYISAATLEEQIEAMTMAKIALINAIQRFQITKDNGITPIQEYRTWDEQVCQNHGFRGANIPNASKHKLICEELNQTYIKKNACYGNSFGDTVRKYGNIAGVTRMHDKFSRIEQLILNKSEDEESLEDNLMDLANYCIMMVMINEKQKGDM